MPPTSVLMETYHEPMAEWLAGLHARGRLQAVRPRLRGAHGRAAPLRRRRGHARGSGGRLRELLGVGWWKHDPEQAAKLLTEAGFTKAGNGWNKPDGTPFTITIFAPADFEVESQRLAFAVANEWTQFGIPTNVQQMQAGAFFTAENTGAYEVGSYWGSSCGIVPGSLRAHGGVAQGLRPPERHADLEQPGPLRERRAERADRRAARHARRTTRRSCRSAPRS